MITNAFTCINTYYFLAKYINQQVKQEYALFSACILRFCFNSVVIVLKINISM